MTSHPDHELARKQFGGRGYGDMIAFAIEGDSATQNKVVNNLHVITSAVSLGHDATLVVHTAAGTRGGDNAYAPAFQKYGHLRLSVGLEDTDDPLVDLVGALDKTSR
ncbi:PLP-dependent transferase [Microbacterium sp. A196]|uniref:PLP-dependent transferase n=1 Tax=Microbacterium sp. A196 TaxID=3457320 RepID=UPI003FD354D0